jgi:hypothetical protein
METMKAILCPRYGSPEVLHIGKWKKPVPRKDEVLIKIYAASVTNSDIFIRSSNIPLKFMIPLRIMLGITRPRNPILGEVFSGEIEYAGSEIKRFKTGDHVYGLTGFSLGAYADYKCMKEIDSKRGCLSVKPKNISFEEATSAADESIQRRGCSIDDSQTPGSPESAGRLDYRGGDGKAFVPAVSSPAFDGGNAQPIRTPVPEKYHRGPFPGFKGF